MLIQETSRPCPRAAFALLAAIVFAVGLSSANAPSRAADQQPESGEATAPEASSAQPDPATKAGSDSMANDPENTAEADARSGVIIVLDLEAGTDGTYDRAAIARAQDALIREAEAAGINFKETRRYTYLPAISARVSAEGLAFLVNSPRVRAIEPDREFKTMPGDDFGGGQLR